MLYEVITPARVVDAVLLEGHPQRLAHDFNNLLTVIIGNLSYNFV